MSTLYNLLTIEYIKKKKYFEIIQGNRLLNNIIFLCEVHMQITLGINYKTS